MVKEESKFSSLGVCVGAWSLSGCALYLYWGYNWSNNRLLNYTNMKIINAIAKLWQIQNCEVR